MDLTPYVAALRDDLAAAASVGDEATARAGTSLAAALEPAVRLALMNALSDLAGEVSASLEGHSVDLRLHGREVEVVVTRDTPEPEGGFFAGPASSPFVGARDGGGGGRPAGPPFPHSPGFGRHGGFGGLGGHDGPDVGDVSRMTLRIVDQIKGQAERAAASQGMSLNSWVAQAVQGALRGQGGWQGSWSDRSGGRPGGWGEPEGSGSDRPERRADGGPSDGGPSAHDSPADGPGSSGPDPSDQGPGPSDGPRSDDGPGRDRGDRGDDGPAGSGGVDGWVRG